MAETAGEPVPVVLLHGVGLDHTMWQPVIDRLGREAISLDLPGHGAQRPLQNPTDLAELAEDVLARMPARPVHLVGFSLGALIAQYIAASHPERVSSLTSVSGVARRTRQEAEAVTQRLELAKTSFAESMGRAIERWFPADSAVPDTVRVATLEVLLANDIESYLHAYEVFATGDQQVAEALSRIDVPTLAITGELDSGSTPQMSNRLAEAVPGARVVIVPGTRHMLPVEHPAALVAELHKFITQTERDER